MELEKVKDGYVVVMKLLNGQREVISRSLPKLRAQQRLNRLQRSFDRSAQTGRASERRSAASGDQAR